MADIVQLLEKFGNDIFRTMKVALPGKIEAYDYKTQKANIKIDIQELYKNGTTLDCPVIGGVPIIFPSSGGAFFTMPVKRGDTCWIMFADRDITRWLFDGRGLPCETVRSHDLNDAVAIMGLHPFIDVFNLENNDDVVISYSGSRVTIKPDGVFNINTTKDVNIMAAEKLNVETGDSTNITAKGIVNIISDDNVNVSSANNIILQSDKETNITANTDIKISADMDIKVSAKNITVDNNELVTINTKNSVINVTESATVNAADVNVNSSNITLDVTDVITTTASTLNIVADVNITGDMNLIGSLDILGETSVVGDSNVTGVMNVQGLVTASDFLAEDNPVLYSVHTHLADTGTTGPPIPGT